MIREYYRSRVKETSINIINSKIESIRSKNIEKTGLRVYSNGLIGVAGAIGAYSDDELYKEALEALEKKIEYPAPHSSDLAISVDRRTEIISPEKLRDEIDALLSELRERQPDFIYSNKISLTEVGTGISNNDSLCLEYADRVFSVEVIFKEKSSSNVFDGFVGARERKYDRKLILDEFDFFLNGYKEKASLPGKGKYPVVFASEGAPITKFLTDLNADVFAQGGSIFSGKTGQKLFNDAFTFGQNLDPDIMYNTPFFDAEGTVNKDYRFNFIEKGVLKAPYCDKKTAHKYGLTPTGSATASYDGVPQSSPIRLYIERTADNVKRLLGGQLGILAIVYDGGDFTPKGDYATPVQLAFLFDGERIIGRLPEFNMSSNIFEMYGPGYRGTAPCTFLPFSTGDFTVIEMDVSL